MTTEAPRLAEYPEARLVVEYENAVMRNDHDGRMQALTKAMSEHNYERLLELMKGVDQKHKVKRQEPRQQPVAIAAEPVEDKRPERKEPMSQGNPKKEAEQEEALKKEPLFRDLIEYIGEHTRIEELSGQEEQWLQKLSKKLSDNKGHRGVLIGQLRTEMENIGDMEDVLAKERNIILWSALISMAYARGRISRDEVTDLMTKEFSTIYTMENRAATKPSDWR